MIKGYLLIIFCGIGTEGMVVAVIDVLRITQAAIATVSHVQLSSGPKLLILELFLVNFWANSTHSCG